MRIGLISDTHGMLRPEAVAALRGCDRIVHAGDVGSAKVLETLAAIAPLHAIAGNIDRAGWAQSLPHTLMLDWEGVTIHVLHDLKQMRAEAAAAVRVVISGHSHRPAMQWRNEVLYINPGSAGPRRFKLPVSVGYLHLSPGQARGELRQLL